MNNQQKFEEFLIIAGVLNEKFASIPILYGSLGLAKALHIELKTDDVDILIEDGIFTEKLSYLRDLMEAMGFELTDRKENEFKRGPLKIGLSADGDLLDFSGVDPATLKVVYVSATYRVLSLEDYLSTYKASSHDGYRKHKHMKNDRAKIALIEQCLMHGL